MEQHIFGSRGRKSAKRKLRSFEVLAELKFGKPNFTSLPIKTERKYGSEASDIRSPGRAKVRKLNFISLAVRAGRTAEAELHIVGRIGRAEVRNVTHVT